MTMVRETWLRKLCCVTATFILAFFGPSDTKVTKPPSKNETFPVNETLNLLEAITIPPVEFVLNSTRIDPPTMFLPPPILLLSQPTPPQKLSFEIHSHSDASSTPVPVSGVGVTHAGDRNSTGTENISLPQSNSNANVFAPPTILPMTSSPPLMPPIFIQPEQHILATPPRPSFFVLTMQPLFGIHSTPLREITQISDHVCGRNGLCDSVGQWKCEVPGLDCHPCRCDDFCLQYGDCCPDRLVSLQLNVTAEPELDSCISTAIKSTVKIKAKRYLMVDTCSENNETAAECRREHLQADVDLVPVYSPSANRHYKNYFCARCNGISDFIFWVKGATCKGFIDYNKIASPESYLAEALTNPSCGIYALPPPESPVRECFFDPKTMISGCPSDYTDQGQITACKFYRHPITIKYSGTFRNAYCANCNGFVVFREVGKCDPQGYDVPETAPLSALFDFRLTEGLRTVADDLSIRKEVVCSTSEIYDSIKGICRSLICPPGKFPKNHTCENFFKLTEGVGYRLLFHLYPEQGGNATIMVSGGELIFNKFRLYSGYLSTATDASMMKLIFESVYMEPLTRDPKEGLTLFNMTVGIYIVVGVKMPRRTLETTLVKFLNDGWFYYNDDSTVPVKFVSRLITDDFNIDVENFDKFFYGSIDIDRNMISRLDQWTQRYSFDVFDSTYLENASSYISVTNLMLCDGVLLDHDEYIEAANMSIIRLDNDQRLNERQYIRQNDSRKIQVCAEVPLAVISKSVQNSTTEPGNNLPFDITETVVTILCTSFSLAGLIITFIVYAITPSLRTLPGKNNMALFFNLFCAQLMFQAGIAADVGVTACRVLGAIIHYLWLSTFVWKLICAYHMFKVFTQPLKRVEDMTTFVKYGIFAQSAPVFTLVIYISVQYAFSPMGHLQVGYADRLIADDRRLCFLSTQLDWALGFASPIVLILLINSYFFIRIVYALQHRPDLTKHHAKSDVKQTVIYLKMALLLGFTWAFGFVAMAVDTQLLWYLFTILNASIGVFVFFSFVHVKSLFRTNKKSKYESTSHNNQSPDVNKLKQLNRQHATKTLSLTISDAEDPPMIRM